MRLGEEEDGWMDGKPRLDVGLLIIRIPVLWGLAASQSAPSSRSVYSYRSFV